MTGADHVGQARIAPLDDPRSLGSVLVGEHAGFWRWRIGGHRVVVRIEEQRVLIGAARGASAGGLSVRGRTVTVAQSSASS